MILRVLLLAGLVAHKALWEMLKRRVPERAASRGGLVKVVKLGALAGLVVQTALPWDIFPVARDPAGLRAAGAALYAAGLAVAMLARIELGRNWSDIEAARVRGDHELVARGPYRYIRHPIYAGDLALVAGLELALNSWLVLGVAPLAAVVWLRAVREEEALAGRLAGYNAYRRRTKRFIPFVA